ncbi:putative immune-type receptor 7 precursor, partial [Clarias magur]
MECNISEGRNRNGLSWYRQSFGKVPQLLVRPYSNTQGYTFVDGFNDSRFSVTVKDQKFDLNINGIREDDRGEYFCGYVEGSTVKFTSGTQLLNSLLCLCTTGKPSELKELDMKTVKLGEAVTMECNISEGRNRNGLSWYSQSFGKVPQFLVRSYTNNQSYMFVEGFTDSRFSVTVNDQKFDLNINETREDDGGEYFCGHVEGSNLKFTSGTRLQFEGEEMKLCPTPGTLNNNNSRTMITRFVALYSLLCLCTTGNTSDIKELHMKTVKRGEAVTMECNISGGKKKDNFAWYRQSFGKVPQFMARPYRDTLGYRFVEGFQDSRFSVTVSEDKFDLNIDEAREDDGGEYFCGYVEGNTLKFTSGTHLQFKSEEIIPCPTTGTLNKNNSFNWNGEEMKPCHTFEMLNNTAPVVDHGQKSSDGK